MSGLRERLLRLRGGAGTSLEGREPAANGAVPAAQPTDDAAETTAANVGGSAPPEADAGQAETPGDAVSAPEADWLALGAETACNARGSFVLRRAVFPAEHVHGRYRLGELADALPRLAPVTERQNRRRTDLAAAPLTAERALFLDLETTGLGVGTGNVPFLIGLAYVESGAFVLEQAFIRHPGEERAALAHLLERLEGRTHLVTFNGRAFDWPLLTGRFILNGWRPTGEGPRHLDLLQPSRALWRYVLPSCRMSVIEEDRLGIEREDDIPGSLAPALYFRFLQDGDPAHVAGVFAHNERDLLTLAALAVYFGRLAGGEASPAETHGRTAAELYGAAAWLDAHGWHERAEPLFREIARREEPGIYRWWLAAADRWKRLGRYEEAVPLWEKAAALAERAKWPAPDAHIQLAIHYEHRRKDPSAALVYAERALQLVAGSPMARNGTRAAAEREAIRHRVKRLRRKCSGSSAVENPN